MSAQQPFRNTASQSGQRVIFETIFVLTLGYSQATFGLHWWLGQE